MLPQLTWLDFDPLKQNIMGAPLKLNINTTISYYFTNCPMGYLASRVGQAFFGQCHMSYASDQCCEHDLNWIHGSFEDCIELDCWNLIY